MGKQIWPLAYVSKWLNCLANPTASLHIIEGTIPSCAFFFNKQLMLGIQLIRGAQCLLNQNVLQHCFPFLISVSMNNLRGCATM